MISNSCANQSALTRVAAIAACALLVLLLLPGMARAASYAEQGDAGDLPLSVQIVNGPATTNLDHITGTLTLSNGISEGDMFEIFINSPTTFSATTTNFVPGSNNFDTQLFLFTAGGVGVEANDDALTGGTQSTLPSSSAMLQSLPAGVYYLLITGSGRYPVDSQNHLIFPNFSDGTTDPTGVYGPNAGALTLNGYTGNSNSGGSYSIALTGAQFIPIPIPEPSVISFLGFGVTGLGFILRRRGAKHS